MHTSAAYSSVGELVLSCVCCTCSSGMVCFTFIIGCGRNHVKTCGSLRGFRIWAYNKLWSGNISYWLCTERTSSCNAGERYKKSLRVQCLHVSLGLIFHLCHAKSWMSIQPRVSRSFTASNIWGNWLKSPPTNFKPGWSGCRWLITSANNEFVLLRTSVFANKLAYPLHYPSFYPCGPQEKRSSLDPGWGITFSLFHSHSSNLEGSVLRKPTPTFFPPMHPKPLLLKGAGAPGQNENGLLTPRSSWRNLWTPGVVKWVSETP